VPPVSVGPVPPVDEGAAPPVSVGAVPPVDVGAVPPVDVGAVPPLDVDELPPVLVPPPVAAAVLPPLLDPPVSPVELRGSAESTEGEQPAMSITAAAANPKPVARPCMTVSLLCWRNLLVSGRHASPVGSGPTRCNAGAPRADHGFNRKQMPLRRRGARRFTMRAAARWSPGTALMFPACSASWS